jgi:hypothetical protein
VPQEIEQALLVLVCAEYTVETARIDDLQDALRVVEDRF